VSAPVIVCNPFSTIVKIEIDQQLEKQINIKFLVKLDKSGPKICQMLQQAYGEYALKRSTVFKSVRRYQGGQKDPMDNKRSGCPSTLRSNENTDRLHSLVLSDRRMTVQMIADELQIGKTFVYSILTLDLEMRKFCAKIVPKLLTPEQKLRRKQCRIDCKALEERGAFLERVITGDESSIYEYDIELKSQNKEWKHQNSRRPKKRGKVNRKSVMLIVFFDCHGIVRHEFIPEGQTVNAGFCVEVLKCLEGSRASCAAEFVRGQRLDPSPGQCPLAHCFDCA
jgi:hypothetical protein